MPDDPRVPTADALATLTSELEAQPAMLERVGSAVEHPDPALERIVAGRRRVAFVGLGSSRDACLAAAWTLRSRGVDATVHMPSEPLGPVGPDALVVAVSASGATPPVIEAVDLLEPIGCPVVAVTRDGGGPVADRADAVVALGCDAEASGIAVWSFLASLVVLDALASSIAGLARVEAAERARRGAERLARIREDGADAIAATADVVRAASVVQLVAPLARLGPGLQAAQVLREVPRLPAVALAAEDWDHAHAYLTVDPGFVGIVSGPTEADDELVRWVVGRGRPLLALGDAPVPDGPGIPYDEPDPSVRTLVECPLVESIALRAWAAARMRP
jgi:fructoselysine-6-P-deglycase FrlB-like protein